jgi:hypothetical protein
MIKLEIYESAVNAGGPKGLTSVLSQFAVDLDWLSAQGVAVERFDLARRLAAFGDNLALAGMIAEGSQAPLVLILVDGGVAYCGEYPTRQELAEIAGLIRPVRSDGGSPPSAARASRCRCCG